MRADRHNIARPPHRADGDISEPLGGQSEVLARATRGQTSADIAGELGISPRTVEKHLESIYERLSVANRAQAIVRALELATPA
jgi:DNA-binding NarL/FixJ family response regulator